MKIGGECFMDKNKYITYLLLIFLLAFAVRTVKVLTKPIVCRGSILYVKMANYWADFGVNEAYNLNPNIPPVYVATLAMGQKYLGLRPEITGDIVGIVLGALLSLAVFFITFSLFDSCKLALIAALLAAVHPYLIRSSTTILRGAAYLPVLAFAIAFAVSAIKNRSLLKWCFFSMLLAVAAMTRHEGFFVLYVFFIWVIFELISSKQPFIQRLRYLVLSACFVFVIFFGIIYAVRVSLSDAKKSSWSNTDLLSMKFTGKIE